QRFTETDAPDLTVADVIAEYLLHAEKEYRPVEVDKLRLAFKPVLERFRSLEAAKFGVSCLEAVQHHLAPGLHQPPPRPPSKRRRKPTLGARTRRSLGVLTDLRERLPRRFPDFVLVHGLERSSAHCRVSCNVVRPLSTTSTSCQLSSRLRLASAP